MNIKIKKFISSNFFRPVFYSIIINPYFIARNGLYNKIKAFANADFSSKKMLDVGCGIKPYETLFKNVEKYIGIDIQGGGHLDDSKSADQYFDGKNIPFGDESFDALISTQVLEHTEDPQCLLKEMCRVLKKDGKIFLTMPFVWNEHETPYDFNRFTRFQHERYFKEANLKIIKIETTCGVFKVCGQLISAFIFEKLAKKNLILKLLISGLLCFPIQLIFIILDTVLKNSWITLDYVVQAKKI